MQSKFQILFNIISITIILLVIFCCWIFISNVHPLIASGDLLPIWAATKVFIVGGNPYNLEEVLSVIKTYTNQSIIVNPVFYLPWSFSVISFIALFNFETLFRIWFILSISIVTLCVLFLFNKFTTRTKLDFYLALILLLSFPPIFIFLKLGQTTPILLAGLSAYLILRGKNKYLDTIAGLALGLTLIKPHLLILVYIHCIYSSIIKRNYYPVLGLFLGFSLMFVTAMIINPNIFENFLAGYSSEAMLWRNPCLGALLMDITSPKYVWLRFLPSLLGMLFTIYLINKKFYQINSQKLLLFIIPLSLVSAPYIWSYDYTLLIPTILGLLIPYLLKDKKLAQISVLVILNLLSWRLGIEELYGIWLPLIYFIYSSIALFNFHKSDANVL